MEEWILKYWLQVIFGAIVTIIVAIYNKQHKEVKRKMKEYEAVQSGVQALLRDRIIQSYNHYMGKGYIPIYAHENICNLFQQYQSLGGNSTICNLMAGIDKLPKQDKEVAS